jgi:hypothetical protein
MRSAPVVDAMVRVDEVVSEFEAALAGFDVGLLAPPSTSPPTTTPPASTTAPPTGPAPTAPPRMTPPSGNVGPVEPQTSGFAMQ